MAANEGGARALGAIARSEATKGAAKSCDAEQAWSAAGAAALQKSAGGWKTLSGRLTSPRSCHRSQLRVPRQCVFRPDGGAPEFVSCLAVRRCVPPWESRSWTVSSAPPTIWRAAHPVSQVAPTARSGTRRT